MTWGKLAEKNKHQTMTVNKDGGWADLFSPEHLYFVAVYCAKRSRWFRVKNKVKLSDKHGRCTSSSWYKHISPPHLSVGRQLAPGDREWYLWWHSSPLISFQLARKKLAKWRRETGERKSEKYHRGFGDAAPAWPLSPVATFYLGGEIFAKFLLRESPGSYISRGFIQFT